MLLGNGLQYRGIAVGCPEGGRPFVLSTSYSLGARNCDRGKAARIEGDPSVPCSVEVKKEWRYTSLPLVNSLWHAPVMLYLFKCFSVQCIRPIAESNDCCVLRPAVTKTHADCNFRSENSQVLCLSEVSFRNVLKLDPRIPITRADKIPCAIIRHKSERRAKKSRH
jgi:hypothetical protein